MIKMNVAEACHILKAKLSSTCYASAPHSFEGLSIDSRTLEPGNLFVAVPGAHFDGHDFTDIAKDKGAHALVVNRAVNTNLPQLQVDNIVTALGKLSTAWRKQFNIPFIAVTGSTGKTTLKNMLAAILTAASHGDKTQVLATVGTLNNEYGLPLTLAKLNKNHRYAVLEMGMNHFGEIEYLTQLTLPQIAIITNAGPCHLAGVYDLAGVAKAKAEIFLGLSSNGIAILNRDDAFFPYWREQIDTRQFLTFGFHPHADVGAHLIDKSQGQCIMLASKEGQIDIHLPLLGKHNIQNALAATAAALALHIPLDIIKTGLESIEPAPGRLQLHELKNGVKIIDDTYNANPFSLNAAIQTLITFTGKKILVLGDMKELGKKEKSMHHTAGHSIREAGIDYLFTFGELSAHAAKAFGEGGYHFSEQDKLTQALKPFLCTEATILVKGSRSMKMEKVIAGLIKS